MAFKDVLSLFPNSFAFCVHLGNYDSSFAIENCLISHKILDGENMSPKDISKILIYFHDFLNKFEFLPCKFFTK